MTKIVAKNECGLTVQLTEGRHSEACLSLAAQLTTKKAAAALFSNRFNPTCTYEYH